MEFVVRAGKCSIVPRRRRHGSTVGSSACAVVVALLAVGVVLDDAALAADPPASQAAETVAVGDPMPSLSLNDQHGTPAVVDAATRVVLFTRDMDGGKLVKEVLADDGAAQLVAAGAVYVSDVSAMPGLIRSMFALPSLRKRPYSIVLDEEGRQTSALPGQEGRATVLTLDSGRITAVSFAGTTAEVRAALTP